MRPTALMPILVLLGCAPIANKPESESLISDPDALTDPPSDAASDEPSVPEEDKDERPFAELLSDSGAPISENLSDVGGGGGWTDAPPTDTAGFAGSDSPRWQFGSDSRPWFLPGSDSRGGLSDSGGGVAPGWGSDLWRTDTDTDAFTTDFRFDTGSAVAQPTSCSAADPAQLALCAGPAAVIGAVSYATLGDAVAAAGPGDTVLVCPGTHNGGLTVGDLTLLAADPAAGATIVTGGARAAVFEHSGGSLHLEGLTLVDGWTRGNGGAVSSGGNLSLRCVTARNNHADGNGGAIDASGKLSVELSVFEENRAGYAGGAISGSGVIIDSQFRANDADYAGGAISSSGDLTLAGSTFDTNTAGYEGGALSWGGWDSRTLTITGSDFLANWADYEGGAMDIGTWADADVVAVTDTRFVANRADGNGGAVNFGTWGGFSAAFLRTRFEGNTAASGAGVNQGGWTQVGATISLTDTAFIEGDVRGQGPALLVGFGDMPTKVDAVRLTVHRNLGGPAVEIRGADGFDCTDCDFGTGADDNSPADARKGGVTTVQAPATFTL